MNWSRLWPLKFFFAHAGRRGGLQSGGAGELQLVSGRWPSQRNPRLPATPRPSDVYRVGRGRVHGLRQLRVPEPTEPRVDHSTASSLVSHAPPVTLLASAGICAKTPRVSELFDLGRGNRLSGA